jgi:hypothetical protein
LLPQDCSELVLIVAAAWTLLEFKGRVISWAVSRLQTDTDPHNDGAVPLLRLLSAVLTVAVVMAATAFTLSGFGEIAWSCSAPVLQRSPLLRCVVALCCCHAGLRGPLACPLLRCICFFCSP